MSRIDHLMWGAADLDRAVQDIAARFGVTPVAGGSHPGRGTRNALLGLGPDCYLEIIAPDPAQELAGTFGAALAGLAEAALVTFAVADADLPAVARALADQGVASRGPLPTRRTTPQGEALHWSLLFPRQHGFGAVLPFYIDWGSTPHPSRSLPDGGRLTELHLGSARAAELGALLANVDGPLRVSALDDSAVPGSLAARIDAPGGPVTLSSTPASAALRFA